MRLLIALPCYDKVEPETTICLALAVRLLPPDTDITGKTGAYVHWHREEFVIRALDRSVKEGFTHLMMIDADIIFPASGIQKLAAHRADIAYGTYNRKNRDYAERLKDPAGFMLVDLEAVKKIEMPRFQCDFGTGEDVYFLRKARAAGLKVVRDDSIEIGHKGSKIY